MLQFFDCLEKLMYNAFEGFAITLAPTTKVAWHILHNFSTTIFFYHKNLIAMTNGQKIND